MKNILQKWRGLTAAALLAVTTLPAAETTLVKTLGGGPNQTSSARAGSADGQTLNFAKFKKPYAAAVDSNGDLFIADFGNGKIRKVTKPGAADSLTSTFVSRLASPSGVAIDRSNVVYVVSQGDGKLRKFSSTGALLETVGGFRAPTAVALSSTGTVYITELSGNIYQVSPNDAPMLIASGLRRPHGIAVLDNGLLAVTESTGHAVQLVDPSTGVATLFAGGNGAGFADGSVAKFNQPYGIALAPNGSLIVADKANHRVRVIGTNNVVSTLYGVSKNEWVSPFPGWADGVGGAEGVAASRDPVGVAVNPAGTVFATEIYWNLLRQATGAPLVPSTPGSVTNIIYDGTNAIVVTGTNVISFGFATGEASSSFIVSPGQLFLAPVTLANAPGQKIYTFQMSLSITGETGVAVDPAETGFVSMVDRRDKIVSRDTTIPFELPQVYTTNYFYTNIHHNATFRNDSINLLGVGWITAYEKTNLYDTLAQDLITYSIAKDTLLGSSKGKVVFGAYGVRIPTTAVPGDSFLIKISNPSGTTDGITTPVQLSVPTNGSLGAGAPNTIKRLTIGSRPYLVGDSTPFGWFNAGDFGDTNLANSDVIDVFLAAVYELNTPVLGSDLYDAMDSANGSSITSLTNGDSFYTAAMIDGITQGDGDLNLDDVFVTFRRGLDPTLKWYARFWSNGVRQAVEVPNTLAGGAGSQALTANKKAKSAGPVVRPPLAVSVDDALTTANSTLQLPIRLQLDPAHSLRTLLMNITVQNLDGSPAVVDGIQIQMAPTFGTPEIDYSRGGNNWSGAWLDNQILGITGNSVLAILNVRIPAGAGPRAAYRVHFDHFSGSPNGYGLFDSRAHSGLILLSDRSASTWSDGIADAWRLRYFGSIFAADSAVGADADGDGVINLIEAQNGTDPTDATSF